MSRHIPRLLIVIGAGFLVYSNSFDCSFHFDDFRNIVCNPALTEPLTILFPESAGLSDEQIRELRLRPVGFISFALNIKTGGLNLFGFHLFNLIIHLLNATLIYFLVLKLLKIPILKIAGAGIADSDSDLMFSDEDISFAVSALFALHPVQTQAVTYIVQRFASLATTFYVSSVLFYVLSRQKAKLKSGNIFNTGNLFYLSAIFCAFLSVKTKENTYTIPLAITLVELCFFKAKLRKRLLLLAPFFILLILFPLSLSIEGQVLPDELVRGKVLTDMSRIDFLLTQFTVIVFYFRLLCLPYGQNLDHDIPLITTFIDFKVVLSFVFIVLLIYSGILLVRKDWKRDISRYLRLSGFGLLWFFTTISAEAGLVPIVDLAYEHRIYLPSVGAFMAVVSLVSILPELYSEYRRIIRKTLELLFACIIVVLSVLTYKRNFVWKDELSLWEDCAKKSPKKTRVLNTYGSALIENNRIPEAIKVLEKAIKIDSECWPAHYNLSICFAKLAKNPDGKEKNPQTLLNYYGLSVMHAEAAKLIRGEESIETEKLERVLQDIKRVKKNIPQHKIP